MGLKYYLSLLFGGKTGVFFVGLELFIKIKSHPVFIKSPSGLKRAFCAVWPFYTTTLIRRVDNAIEILLL